MLTRISQTHEGDFFVGLIRIKNNIYQVFASPKSEHIRDAQHHQRRAIKKSESVVDGFKNTENGKKSKSYVCDTLLQSSKYIPSIVELGLFIRNTSTSISLNDEEFQVFSSTNINGRVIHPSVVGNPSCRETALIPFTIADREKLETAARGYRSSTTHYASSTFIPGGHLFVTLTHSGQVDWQTKDIPADVVVPFRRVLVATK